MRRAPALIVWAGVLAALALAAPVLTATPLPAASHETQASWNREATANGWTKDRGVTSRRATATTSEGLGLLDVPAWHAAGHFGAGVTVAIMDLGFKGHNDVPADELPADLVTVAFDGDTILDRLTDHGTQMAEIVHDVAPGADLVAMTFSDHRFAEAVPWLKLAGVDVVSFSMEWTDGPLDGTHWTAPIIQASLDAGITWVVAASSRQGTRTAILGPGMVRSMTVLRGGRGEHSPHAASLRGGRSLLTSDRSPPIPWPRVPCPRPHRPDRGRGGPGVGCSSSYGYSVVCGKRRDTGLVEQ